VVQSKFGGDYWVMIRMVRQITTTQIIIKKQKVKAAKIKKKKKFQE